MPVLLERTQKETVTASALDVPFFKDCKFWPSMYWTNCNVSPAEGEASAVVQSNLNDFAKPWPVGTVVDCEIVKVPSELASVLNLSKW